MEVLKNHHETFLSHDAHNGDHMDLCSDQRVNVSRATYSKLINKNRF